MYEGSDSGQNRLLTPPNASMALADSESAAPAPAGEPGGTAAPASEQNGHEHASPPSPELKTDANKPEDDAVEKREAAPADGPRDTIEDKQEAAAASEGVKNEPEDKARPDVAIASLKNEHTEILSQFVDAKSGSAEATAAAVAALNAQAGPDAPRVSLALLLEASAAAAEAEQKAEQQRLDPDTLRKFAEDRAETDKYITDAIHRVQTTPRDERVIDLRPLDRRESQPPAEWSRYAEIKKDAQLLGECRRLVRGTQGCGRECDAKFTNLIDFAKHVDEMHDVNFRPFLCPQERCPWGIIGFHERSECTRHIRTKHYRAMYACEYQGCTKVYNRSDAFRRHVRQAHANPGSRFNRLTQRSDDAKN